jgi:hypothetical protein
MAQIMKAQVTELELVEDCHVSSTPRLGAAPVVRLEVVMTPGRIYNLLI